MEALSGMVGDHARAEEGVDDFRIVCPKSFGDVVHLEAEINGCIGTDNLTPEAFVDKEVLLADDNFIIVDLWMGLDVGSNELNPQEELRMSVVFDGALVQGTADRPAPSRSSSPS